MFGSVAPLSGSDLFLFPPSRKVIYFAFFRLVAGYFIKKEYICSPNYAQKSNKINITISL